MARIKGMFSVSANYEPTIVAPLDAREVVQYKSDLFARKTWLKNGSLFVYNGLKVSVVQDTEENNGVYVLLNKDLYMEETSWKQLATTEELKKLQEKVEHLSIGAGGLTIVDSAQDLPNPGSSGMIYYCREQGVSKSWDSLKNSYITVGSDFNEIKVISGGNSVRK